MCVYTFVFLLLSYPIVNYIIFFLSFTYFSLTQKLNCNPNTINRCKFILLVMLSGPYRRISEFIVPVGGRKSSCAAHHAEGVFPDVLVVQISNTEPPTFARDSVLTNSSLLPQSYSPFQGATGAFIYSGGSPRNIGIVYFITLGTFS